MSAKRRRRWPRVLQGLVGYLLTLTLVLSLTGACVLTLAQRLLTDQALHERVATDERVIDLQMARVDEEVRGLAEECSFAPETVLGLVTRERAQAYGREIVAWWIGLMSEQPTLTAPLIDTSDIEEAVRADELFRENTDEFMRRTIARDSVAYPVSKILQETVLPIRASVVALAMPKVMERVSLPRLLGLLKLAVLGLYGASAALLMLLLISQGKNRCLFASAGLLATDALLAAMTVAVMAAHLPQAVAGMSATLGLQVSILFKALAPSVLIVEGALLLVGAALLVGSLRAVRRTRGQAAETDA